MCVWVSARICGWRKKRMSLKYLWLLWIEKWTYFRCSVTAVVAATSFAAQFNPLLSLSFSVVSFSFEFRLCFFCSMLFVFLRFFYTLLKSFLSVILNCSSSSASTTTLSYSSLHSGRFSIKLRQILIVGDSHTEFSL